MDWLFGMFGFGKGKKGAKDAENDRQYLKHADKYPIPPRRELILEDGNSETAMNILAFLQAEGEKSCGEIADALEISSKPWLSKTYLAPLIAQGYIALTIPARPKSPLQRYKLLQKGLTLL